MKLFQKNSKYKILIYAFGTVLLLIGLFYAFNSYIYHQKTKQVEQEVEERLVNLSNNLSYEYDVDGQKNTSVAGNVESMSGSGLYTIRTVEGNVLKLKTTENTLFGKRWQQKDEDGNIVSSYDEIPANEFKIFEGESVRVTYVQTDASDVYEVIEFTVY